MAGGVNLPKGFGCKCYAAKNAGLPGNDLAVGLHARVHQLGGNIARTDVLGQSLGNKL